MNKKTEEAVVRVIAHRRKKRDTKVWQAQLLSRLDGRELLEAARALMEQRLAAGLRLER